MVHRGVFVSDALGLTPAGDRRCGVLRRSRAQASVECAGSRARAAVRTWASPGWSIEVNNWPRSAGPRGCAGFLQGEAADADGEEEAAEAPQRSAPARITRAALVGTALWRRALRGATATA